MIREDYFEQISAGAISPQMPDCKAIIINTGSQEHIMKALRELYSWSLYKIYVVNTTLAKLPKVLERCREAGKPAIVNCGEKLPDMSGILPKSAYSSSLISPGSYSSEKDNILTGLLNDGYLMNFSNLGFQSYRYSPQIIHKLKERYFEDMRLGALRDDISLCEPLLRNAQYVFMDMRSIRYSDYPCSPEANPNGLYAEEACMIARYTGLGQKLSAVFIFGGVKADKQLTVCNKLIAEIIWHICEAVAVNLIEDPANTPSQEHYMKKIVNLGDSGQEITFITSTSTGRWWMEIPCGESKSIKFIPCSEKDYNIACSGEVPLRWLFFYTKYTLL